MTEPWSSTEDVAKHLPVAPGRGAKCALISIENKRNFLDASADIMEHVDPLYFGFGDPKTAVMKGRGE